MSFSILVAALLAPAGGTIYTHSLPVQPGSQIIATYRAMPVVTTRQIGAAAGTRMGTVRCTWKAAISIERRLETGGANPPTRTLAPVRTLAGSRHGDCMVGRRAIDQEIAGRAPEIQAHLEAVAMQDQRDLRAEVESLGSTGGR